MDNINFRFPQNAPARGDHAKTERARVAGGQKIAQPSGQRRNDQPFLRAEMNDLVARERGQEERAEKLGRFYKILIVVLLGVVLVELVYHLVIGPQMQIRTIKINAEPGIEMSNQQILDLAELTGRLSYLSVDAQKAERNLQRSPFVQKAEVRKNFPDELEIVLKRRTALGLALERQGGEVVPLVFDENGVVFQVGQGLVLEDLPIVSGIRFPDPRPGLKMPDTLVVFLKDLAALKSQAPELFGLISEVKFVKKNASDYEVILFPRNYQTKVRIGPRINENLMKNIVMVLDMVKKENLAPALEELDFRSSKIVYKIREE